MEVYSIIFQTSVNELSLLKSLIVDLESSNWYQIEALDQINTQMFGNFGSSINKSLKNVEIQFVTAPMLKLL